MFDDDIQDLYQQLILDHNAHPHHFGRPKEHTHHAFGHNPLCGDEVEIFLSIQQGRINEIFSYGQGCAISKSSASIMTDELKGKSIAQARQIFQAFHELLTVEDQKSSHRDLLDKSGVFAGVRQFPMRVKCATLSWHTMMAALENQIHSVTTE